MGETDTASLQNLHDIVVPGPMAWWPPAPGWYAVITLVLVVVLVLLWKSGRQWRRNRYRGEALREVAKIRLAGTKGDLRVAPILLKRAALSAWPREAVAGLVGTDWHRFLDESAQTDRFCSGVGDLLDRLAYSSGSGRVLSEQESAAVLDAVQMWLKRHRVPGEGD
jgi:hypothetical protein